MAKTLDDIDDETLGRMVRDRMKRLGKDAITAWNADSRKLRMQRDGGMPGNVGEAKQIEPGVDEDLLEHADPGSAGHGPKPADPTVDRALAMDENQARRCGFSEAAILQARARRSSTGASVAAMDRNIKGYGRLK